MSTTVPTPTRQPAAAAVRCDRCGARAVAITHHSAADLGWCGHHLREHSARLTAAGVRVTHLSA